MAIIRRMKKVIIIGLVILSLILVGCSSRFEKDCEEVARVEYGYSKPACVRVKDNGCKCANINCESEIKDRCVQEKHIEFKLPEK